MKMFLLRGFVVVAIAAGSVQCSTHSAESHPYSKSNPIEIGMSQSQVRSALGKPDEVSSRPPSSVSVINGKRFESGAQSTWKYVHHKNQTGKALRNAGSTALAVGTIGIVNLGPDVKDTTNFEVEFIDGRVSGWE